jgi:hypothetical protein
MKIIQTKIKGEYPHRRCSKHDKRNKKQEQIKVEKYNECMSHGQFHVVKATTLLHKTMEYETPVNGGQIPKELGGPTSSTVIAL